MKVLTNPSLNTDNGSKVSRENMHVSNTERQMACNSLAEKLASLISKMVLTEKKYTEPSEVLRALVDDFGQPMLLGE